MYYDKIFLSKPISLVIIGLGDWERLVFLYLKCFVRIKTEYPPQTTFMKS